MEFWSKGLGKRTIALGLSKGESSLSTEALCLRGNMEEPVSWEYVMLLEEPDVGDFFALLREPELARFIHASPNRWRLYAGFVVGAAQVAWLVLKAAVLRRSAGAVPPALSGPLRAGSLQVDPVAHETHLGDEPVHLTAKEFDLLVHLMSHPRQAFRREELLESVWGWTYGDAATVTVHVRRLRSKIEQDPSTPQHLVTVAGGYRFDP